MLATSFDEAATPIATFPVLAPRDPAPTSTDFDIMGSSSSLSTAINTTISLFGDSGPTATTPPPAAQTMTGASPTAPMHRGDIGALEGGIAAGVLGMIITLLIIAHFVLRGKLVEKLLGGSHQSVLDSESTIYGTSTIPHAREDARRPYNADSDSSVAEVRSYSASTDGRISHHIGPNSRTGRVGEPDESILPHTVASSACSTVATAASEPPPALEDPHTIDMMRATRNNISSYTDRFNANNGVADYLTQEEVYQPTSPTTPSNSDARSQIQQLQDQCSEVIRVRDDSSYSAPSREELSRQIERPEAKVAILMAQNSPPEYDALSIHES